ncbi:CopG family transcriptional regulator [Cellulosimicrobium funkei]|nr:CopG family transcriptional regulator [Cellulosimicrobium funkei]
MKTAISIPDDTFKDAEAAAARLGISRSEFFTRAAVAYIRESESDAVTARVNTVLSRGPEDSEFAVIAGRRVLRDSEGDW